MTTRPTVQSNDKENPTGAGDSLTFTGFTWDRISGELSDYAPGVDDKTAASTTPAWATDRPGDDSPFALGLLLRRAHDRTTDAMAAAMRPFGLELRHFAVMIELARSGPLNQRDLGLAIGMDKAMIVRVVDDLERHGLAERKLIPGDRRMRSVEMTARGLEVFEAAHANGRPIAADLSSHLGEGEYDRLVNILTRYTYPHESEKR